MDVKEAVQKAAASVDEIVGMTRGDSDGQPFYDFAIEGVQFDETNNAWQIEVGYVLPWDKAKQGALAVLASGPASNSDKRTFKRIIVPDCGNGPIQMTAVA